MRYIILTFLCLFILNGCDSTTNENRQDGKSNNTAEGEVSSKGKESLTTIYSGYKSYVNEKNEICVVDAENNTTVYSYDGEAKKHQT